MYLDGSLQVAIRERLGRQLQARYLRDRRFYKLNAIDTAVDNPCVLRRRPCR